MTLLFSALLGLTLIALGILAVPLVQTRQVFSCHFLAIGLYLLITAGGLYGLTTDGNRLKHWIDTGSAHYQLRSQFAALGGIDGAIIKIRDVLSRHPDDVDGWVLLGKLSLGQADRQQAQIAFDKALALKPHDKAILLLQQKAS